MKIKKISAIILAGALLASAVGMNAFADSTSTKPTITVYGQDVAVEKDNTVDLNVRLSNFKGVAGLDISLEGTGITFNSASEVSTLNLEKGVNYKIDNNKLHIVELNSSSPADEITIKLNATITSDSDPKIEVASASLAKDGKDLFLTGEYVLVNKTGSIAVVPAEKTVSTGSISDSVDKFIPYGTVYTGENNFVDKDGNGTFTINADTKYREFSKPTNGILTFGVSNKFKANDGKSPNLQFGSYTNNTKNGHGTMLIVGNWQAYVDSVIKATGKTTDDILAELYVAKTAEGKQYARVSYTNADNEDKVILVYKKVQASYMWKASDNSSFEYALRVINSKTNTCTAVGYYVNDNGTPVFSNQLKSSALS